MTMYSSFTFECDSCELETNSFCDITEAVAQLRSWGWTIEDDGHSALCEDCKETS